MRLKLYSAQLEFKIPIDSLFYRGLIPSLMDLKALIAVGRQTRRGRNLFLPFSHMLLLRSEKTCFQSRPFANIHQSCTPNFPHEEAEFSQDANPTVPRLDDGSGAKHLEWRMDQRTVPGGTSLLG
jgi:hypothetical protein